MKLKNRSVCVCVCMYMSIHTMVDYHFFQAIFDYLAYIMGITKGSLVNRIKRTIKKNKGVSSVNISIIPVCYTLVYLQSSQGESTLQLLKEGKYNPTF